MLFNISQTIPLIRLRIPLQIKKSRFCLEYLLLSVLTRDETQTRSGACVRVATLFLVRPAHRNYSSSRGNASVYPAKVKKKKTARQASGNGQICAKLRFSPKFRVCDFFLLFFSALADAICRGCGSNLSPACRRKLYSSLVGGGDYSRGRWWWYEKKSLIASANLH